MKKNKFAVEMGKHRWEGKSKKEKTDSNHRNLPGRRNRYAIINYRRSFDRLLYAQLLLQRVLVRN